MVYADMDVHYGALSVVFNRAVLAMVSHKFHQGGCC